MGSGRTVELEAESRVRQELEPWEQRQKDAIQLLVLAPAESWHDLLFSFCADVSFFVPLLPEDYSRQRSTWTVV